MNDYYLIAGNGDSRDPIQKLETNDMTLIKGACEAIYEFEYFDRRFVEIKLNFDEFFKVFKESEVQLLSQPDDKLRDKNFNLIFIDINRTFSNYISSYKLQIDHCDQRLMSKYGENSEQYEEFKKHKNSTFDTHFTYRLIYYLRNFSQHKDFAINDMSIDSVRIGDDKYEDEFIISFDKNQLLKDKDIKRKLSLDLTLYNDFFPAMPHIKKSFELLNGFYRTYLKIEKDFLFENIKILEKYIIKIPQNKEPLFGYLNQTAKNTFVFHTTTFPIDIIAKLKLKYTELGL